MRKIEEESDMEKAFQSTEETDQDSAAGEAAAFAALSRPTAAAEAPEPAETFARGLPAWSLEPPRVVVRRRK